MDITKLILTKKQIKAGLKVYGDEDFVILETKDGKVLANFTSKTTREYIRGYADSYLAEIGVINKC